NTIVAGIRLKLVDRCAGPDSDGRFRSHRRSDRRKGETRRAANAVLSERGIVRHVAFAGMRLTPGVLMRRDILSFGIISRSRIEGCVQVTNFHKNPVRGSRMRVASVRVWRRSRISPRVSAGKGIYPGARPQGIVAARIQTGAVGI